MQEEMPASRQSFIAESSSLFDSFDLPFQKESNSFDNRGSDLSNQEAWIKDRRPSNRLNSGRTSRAKKSITVSHVDGLTSIRSGSDFVSDGEDEENKEFEILSEVLDLSSDSSLLQLLPNMQLEPKSHSQVYECSNFNFAEAVAAEESCYETNDSDGHGNIAQGQKSRVLGPQSKPAFHDNKAERRRNSVSIITSQMLHQSSTALANAERVLKGLNL